MLHVIKHKLHKYWTNIAKNSAESIISKHGANKEVGEIKFFPKEY